MEILFEPILIQCIFSIEEIILISHYDWRNLNLSEFYIWFIPDNGNIWYFQELKQHNPFYVHFGLNHKDSMFLNSEYHLKPFSD